jgi:hypothetical protein
MTLAEVIEWRWPGARVIVRGDVLERWDGPMPQPSAAELTQAVTDYEAQGVARLQTRQRDLALRGIKALAIAIQKRLRAANVDTITPAQWQNQIETEWDNLG